MAPKMAGSIQGQSVLHSPACKRNREPILATPTNNRTLIFQLEELPGLIQSLSQALLSVLSAWVEVGGIAPSLCLKAPPLQPIST